MAEGMGSASNTMALGVALLCLLIHCQVAESAMYIVGDSGWAFDVVNWPIGKHFIDGDVLVFKYYPGYHNVVAVDAAGFKHCTTPRGARVYKSGDDHIRLHRGGNYFICGFMGHCQAGMRVNVTADP